MIYFLALIPATALTVAGYFVLFLSNRSEGALRAFGKYLGFWAFTLAGLVVLGAIFAAAYGPHHCPFHLMGDRMYGMGDRVYVTGEGMHGMGGMHCHMEGGPPGGPQGMGPPPPPGETPNPPAPPASAAPAK